MGRRERSVRRSILAVGLLVTLLVAMIPADARGQQGEEQEIALIDRGCCLSEVQDGAVVEKLEIRGNKAITDEVIENSIATTATGRWPWSDEHYLHKSEFVNDLRRLHILYQRHGYFSAELESYTVRATSDGEARITLTVREGEPTRVESLTIESIDADADSLLEELREEMPVAEGDVFTERGIQASRDTLEAGFKNRGHAFARVLLEYRIRKEERTASVTYTVDPGDVYSFGEVEYDEKSVGEEDRELISRHLAFETGDRYSLADIRKSQRQIFDVGLYRRVDIEPKLSALRGDTVDVAIGIVLAPVHVVSIGLGYGTEDFFRAQASWLNRNLFGEGRQLEVSTRYSRLEREGTITYRQPVLVQAGISFSSSAFLRFEVEDNYTVERTGATARIARRLGPRWRGTMSFTAERDDFSEFDRGVLVPELGRSFINPSRLVFVQAGVTYDSTDSLFNPTRGYTARMGYRLAVPFLTSDYGYHRLTLEATHYVKVSEGWIVAFKVLPGAIFTYGGEDARVPLFQRLFAGGATSVRGYGRRMLGPKDDPVRFGQERDPEPVGGNGLLEGSVELRFPIRGNFRGAAFVDMGNVWSDVGDISPTDLEYTPGLGLRYETIVGPFRLDVARKIDTKEDFLPSWVLHISIGHAF